MLRRHPGQWFLSFDHDDPLAARFWPAVVAAVAEGPIDSSDHYPPEIAYPVTWLRFRVARVLSDPEDISAR
jgi:hypothetical protein